MFNLLICAHRHPSWNKVPVALSLLHMYDWIWLIDGDTLIMNSSIPLTDYIDPDYDVVVRRVLTGCVGCCLQLPSLKLNICVLWLQVTKGEQAKAREKQEPYAWRASRVYCMLQSSSPGCSTSSCGGDAPISPCLPASSLPILSPRLQWSQLWQRAHPLQRVDR